MFSCPPQHEAALQRVKERVGVAHSMLDGWLYLFLENKKFNVDEAVAKLHRRTALERNDFSKYAMTIMMRESLSSGVLQSIGKDKLGHPAVYVMTCRDFPTAERRPMTQMSMDMWLSYASRVTATNTKCKVTWLVNQKGSSLMKNTDLTIQKDMMLRISKYFPNVMHRLFLVNMSSAVTFVLKPLVRRFPASISEMITIVSESDLQRGLLLEHFDASVLPTTLGGQNDCEDDARKWRQFAADVESYMDGALKAISRTEFAKEVSPMKAYEVELAFGQTASTSSSSRFLEQQEQKQHKQQQQEEKKSESGALVPRSETEREIMESSSSFSPVPLRRNETRDTTTPSPARSNSTGGGSPATAVTNREQQRWGAAHALSRKTHKQYTFVCLRATSATLLDLAPKLLHLLRERRSTLRTCWEDLVAVASTAETAIARVMQLCAPSATPLCVRLLSLWLHRWLQEDDSLRRRSMPGVCRVADVSAALEQDEFLEVSSPHRFLDSLAASIGRAVEALNRAAAETAACLRCATRLRSVWDSRVSHWEIEGQISRKFAHAWSEALQCVSGYDEGRSVILILQYALGTHGGEFVVNTKERDFLTLLAAMVAYRRRTRSGRLFHVFSNTDLDSDGSTAVDIEAFLASVLAPQQPSFSHQKWLECERRALKSVEAVKSLLSQSTSSSSPTGSPVSPNGGGDLPYGSIPDVVESGLKGSCDALFAVTARATVRDGAPVSALLLHETQLISQRLSSLLFWLSECFFAAHALHLLRSEWTARDATSFAAFVDDLADVCAVNELRRVAEEAALERRGRVLDRIDAHLPRRSAVHHTSETTNNSTDGDGVVGYLLPLQLILVLTELVHSAPAAEAPSSPRPMNEPIPPDESTGCETTRLFVFNVLDLLRHATDAGSL